MSSTIVVVVVDGKKVDSLEQPKQDGIIVS